MTGAAKLVTALSLGALSTAALVLWMQFGAVVYLEHLTGLLMTCF